MMASANEVICLDSDTDEEVNKVSVKPEPKSVTVSKKIKLESNRQPTNVLKSSSVKPIKCSKPTFVQVTSKPRRVSDVEVLELSDDDVSHARVKQELPHVSVKKEKVKTEKASLKPPVALSQKIKLESKKQPKKVLKSKVVKEPTVEVIDLSDEEDSHVRVKQERPALSHGRESGLVVAL